MKWHRSVCGRSWYRFPTSVQTKKQKANFDVQLANIAHRSRELGLDDSLVRPSYVVNVSSLQEKLNKTILNEPEVEYHKDNKAFLETVLREFKTLTGETDA